MAKMVRGANFPSAFGAPGTPRAWSGLLAPVLAKLSDEPPDRTFFLIELLVKAPWRRLGVASAMLGLLFTGHPQERAMLTALPEATAAQAAYRTWGWQKVAQKRNWPRATPSSSATSPPRWATSG